MSPGWTRIWWWARLDSNQGPTDYESAALTAELRARHVFLIVHPDALLLAGGCMWRNESRAKVTRDSQLQKEHGEDAAQEAVDLP
jgi:hypothetical protein